MATVDKPEAAERLIVGPRRLSLADRRRRLVDLSLLRELIEKGGDNYVAQVLKLGLFHAASARLMGDAITLPTNPQIHALIEKVRGGMEAG